MKLPKTIQKILLYTPLLGALTLGCGGSGGGGSKSAGIPYIPITPTPVSSQCNNGVDDDGDTLVDLLDPGCTSPTDNDETNTQPPTYLTEAQAHQAIETAIANANLKTQWTDKAVDQPATFTNPISNLDYVLTYTGPNPTYGVLHNNVGCNSAKVVIEYASQNNELNDTQLSNLEALLQVSALDCVNQTQRPGYVIISYKKPDNSPTTTAEITTQVQNLLASEDAKINYKPVAEAGYDKAAMPGTSINFDASMSYDLDGSIIRYTWVFGDGEIYQETSTSAPDGLFDGKTTHVYNSSGDYTITTTVEDDENITSSDTATAYIL